MPKIVSWLAVRFTGAPSRDLFGSQATFPMAFARSLLLTVAGPLRILTAFRFFWLAKGDVLYLPAFRRVKDSLYVLDFPIPGLYHCFEAFLPRRRLTERMDLS
jgi:hypothetical protein